MREVLQSLRASHPHLADVVTPAPGPGQLLVRTAASVISAGTERMLTEFAKAGPVGKARRQPERVRQVAEKLMTDGVGATIDSVRARLDEPITLGYANAGYVTSLGSGVTGFQVGDLVASNGPHAEQVVVPVTLSAAVPPALRPEQAAFASLGAIGLQGIRLAEPTLGERFVVIGLGLIGLLTVQLLRAHGCEVLGIDVDDHRLRLAEALGARTMSADSDATIAAQDFAPGGVDGAIVTASSRSSAPIHQAAQMCRKRGRIVLVGVTGINIRRSDFYEKELSFQVSCSYGPGRYDPTYEKRSADYPPGFVRWTAGRNFAAVLDMMDTGRLDVDSLITHRLPLHEAPEAYRILTEDPKVLAIVLEYPSVEEAPVQKITYREPTQTQGRPTARSHRCSVAVIGAGQFARAVMLPTLKDAGADIVAIASQGGSAASVAADKWDIPRVANDAESLVKDPDIDVIVVLTRHDSHARLASLALESGKHVFVEKPLAIDRSGLERVIAAWEQRSDDRPVLGVGFNRRFAPTTARMAEVLRRIPGPRAITITVNAGAVPSDHWTQDPTIGGGRIIGEACHYLDLARFLSGSPIVEVLTTYLRQHPPNDSASIALRHENGSVSSIGYFSNGSKRFPKERVTVFTGGLVLVNDNFRRLSVYGSPRARRRHLLRQDKGHRAEIARFLSAVRGEAPVPIPFDQIVEVTAATLLAADRD